MSEVITLKATKREETGKGANRRLRAKNLVPGVFYSKGENIAVALESLPLEKAFAQVSTSQLLNLDIEGETRPVIIREFRRHPYKTMLEHVDFYGVDMDKPVRVRVRVNTVGESEAVKMGAKLLQFRDAIDIECLPANIPADINIDVNDLKLNENLIISEVPMPEGVKAVYDDNFAVVGVTLKNASDDEEEEGAEEEAAAE